MPRNGATTSSNAPSMLHCCFLWPTLIAVLCNMSTMHYQASCTWHRFSVNYGHHCQALKRQCPFLFSAVLNWLYHLRSLALPSELELHWAVLRDLCFLVRKASIISGEALADLTSFLDQIHTERSRWAAAHQKRIGTLACYTSNFSESMFFVYKRGRELSHRATLIQLFNVVSSINDRRATESRLRRERRAGKTCNMVVAENSTAVQKVLYAVFERHVAEIFDAELAHCACTCPTPVECCEHPSAYAYHLTFFSCAVPISLTDMQRNVISETEIEVLLNPAFSGGDDADQSNTNTPQPKKKKTTLDVKGSSETKEQYDQSENRHQQQLCLAANASQSTASSR